MRSGRVPERTAAAAGPRWRSRRAAAAAVAGDGTGGKTRRRRRRARRVRLGRRAHLRHLQLGVARQSLVRLARLAAARPGTSPEAAVCAGRRLRRRQRLRAPGLAAIRAATGGAASPAQRAVPRTGRDAAAARAPRPEPDASRPAARLPAGHLSAGGCRCAGKRLCRGALRDQVFGQFLPFGDGCGAGWRRRHAGEVRIRRRLGRRDVSGERRRNRIGIVLVDAPQRRERSRSRRCSPRRRRRTRPERRGGRRARTSGHGRIPARYSA